MSTFHDTQDEIHLIQKEVTKQRMIYQLQEKRAALVRRLNDVRSATRNMPPETLALVFEHYVVEDHPSRLIPLFDSPSILQKRSNTVGFTLGHVSSYWRQVAWSTPRLWTGMIGLPSLGTPGTLNIHLQNVGGLPFSLLLNFIIPWEYRIDGETVESAANSIANLLTNAEYSRKVRRLDINGPPPEWFWGALGSLTCLTHLTFAKTPIDRCIGMLMQCPNLVSFDMHCPTHGNFSHFNPPDSRITFQHLQNFGWLHRTHEECQAVLRHIRLPAVQTIEWSEPFRGGEQDASYIQALFHDLPNTLRIIHLYGPENWTLPLVTDVFSQSVSVRKLTVHDPDKASLYAIARVLSTGLDRNGNMYLPFLKCFKFVGYLYEDDVDTELSSRILDICKARFTKPGSKFRCHFAGPTIPWAPGVLEELRKMVQDGCNFEIDSESGIDFLS